MENFTGTERIMAEIKRKATLKDSYGEIPRFEDIPFEKTYGTDFKDNPDKAVNCMKSCSFVRIYNETEGSPLSVTIKKAIRRIVGFYIKPIAEGQNKFNMSAVTAVISLRNEQKKLIKRIENLEKENSLLKKKLYGESK